LLHRAVNGKKEKTGAERAEVCFVPSAIGHSKKGPEYRYLAKRQAMAEQLGLPGLESQPVLPFQTMAMQGKKYKLFGIVTNMDWAGEGLIHWHHERCGKSEEAHSGMKAIRFSIIQLPGRVVERSRDLILRLTKNHPSLGLLIEARRRIAMLAPIPAG